FHTHFAISIIHSFEERFEIDFKGEKQNYKTVFLPSMLTHKLHSPGSVLIVQIDPDYAEFLPLENFSKTSPTEIKELELLDENFIGMECSTAKQFVINLIHKIGKKSLRPQIKIDYRIKNSLDYLKKLEEIPSKLPIESLAKRVNLSSERFRHLFSEEVGMNFRRYLLWLRIRKAGESLKSGFTLTDAAHNAGFTDSAHFSKVFKENFGISPSKIFGSNQTEVNFCDIFLDR
ncbi:MAG: helix-turn-helix transcriptional regulator, partial [Leptospiraceae bacterium]|nr:helix-turn-helix transcriptional regulator [Leptospiraceae bacterium]